MPLRVVGAVFPSWADLCDEHPCHFKPVYYAMFAEPVRDAMLAAGVATNELGARTCGLAVRFDLSDGSKVKALIDYADQVHIDGLVAHAMLAEKPDLLFKMKPCDRFGSEYREFSERHGIPVLPWGYVIAPTHSGDPRECVDDRAWFFSELPALRATQAAAIASGGGNPRLMTRGSFHALHHCEERRRFFDSRIFQGEKTDVDFRQHMRDVSGSGFILNACGPDNTIDRKVVEACAMGVPIISNDGLLDLRLPYGCRFVHGENVWFVRSADEALAASRELGVETRRRLSAGGLSLYKRCFAPSAVGRHMVEQVLAFAAAR